MAFGVRDSAAVIKGGRDSGVKVYGNMPVAAFDPSSLSLTGWWRGSYAGSPWVGQASAGTSGGRNLIAGVAPAVGAAQNGFTPPDFNGSTHFLSNASAISTFISASAYFWWVLYYSAATGGVNTLATAANNPHTLAETGGYIGCSMTSAGGPEKVQAWHYDGAYRGNEHAHTLNAYHLLCCRYDGSNVRSKLDSGSVLVSAAAGNVQVVTGTLLSGKNFGSSAFFTGRILDMGIRNVAGLDADFGDIKTYVNSRYGLSL